MDFSTAVISDIDEICALINRAYRGDSSRIGWTTEADLLGGLRIDETGIRKILDDPDSLFFTALNDDQKPVATLHALYENGQTHFGLFAVDPQLQNRGIGGELLRYSERETFRIWGSSTCQMEVITLRQELIAFYERHGYSRTGESVKFPLSDLWNPKVSGLEMAVLIKRLG